MRLHSAGADAGAATAVRDAEGFVQIQMRDVRAPLAWLGDADQRIHVGAVGVDLTAVRMNRFADRDDVLFEHAMRGRIRHHQRGEAVAIFLCIAADVVEVHIAVRIAFGHDHGHAAHLRGCRIGAVRGFRDQTNIAMGVAARTVVRANREQAGVFALRAGIRLQAHRVVAGAFDQHRFQFVDQLLVAQRLIGRCKRMQMAEFRPRHRNHLGGGVEFHRAAAERDHRPIHRQIFVGQRAHVAQQFVLAVMRIEHRMGQECAGAQQCVRQRVVRVHVQAVDVAGVGAEQCGDGDDVAACGGFVETDAEAARVDTAQIDLFGTGARMHGFGIDAGDVQRVEELLADMHAFFAQGACEDRGQTMRTTGDANQTFGAVIHRVHARHHRQQHLCGADVRGGFLATDVLLAGLQRQAVGGLAFGIDRNADQAPRHRTFVGIAAGHERRMRATETERHAETLAVADDDIGAPFAGRGDQRQREQIGRDSDHAAARVDGIGEGLVVVDRAEGVRVLQQHAEAVDARGLGLVADDQFDAQRFGASAQHFEGLRMHAVGSEKDVGLRLRRTLGEGHRFGGGGGFVQ